MAGLHFDITGDNSNLMRKLEETKTGVSNTSKEVEKSGASIEDMFGRLERAAAAFGIALSAKEIVNKVVQIRGEFQQLEVAFKTMLGSEEKANNLMLQLVKTAATTPFDLQGVANGAKQLLAYGEDASKVNDDLIRLGNVAAGLSIPLGDIVYLYGTTMTQGRIYTQDLNQFVGRGIPMIKEFAKQFGVSEQQVRKLVEAGEVGFPQVKKAFEDLTNKGGMFYNLMEEQSKTFTGQISNIGDSISMAFNKIGKSQESIINGALSGIAYLIENYEEVGKVILEVAAAYGAYKAILMTISALEALNAKIVEQAAVEKRLAAMSDIALSEAEAMASAKTVLLKDAQLQLNSAFSVNPYAIVTAALIGLSYIIYKNVTQTTALEEAHKRLSESTAEIEKSVVGETAKLSSLEKKLAETKKGSKEWNNVKQQIVSNYGQYYKGLDGEIDRVGNLSHAYKTLVTNIRNSIAARKFESFSKQEQDRLDKVIGDKLDKSYNLLIEKYGKNAGLKLYQNLFDYATTGKPMSTGTWKLLGDASFGERGFKNSPVGYSQRSVSDLALDMYNETKASREATKEMQDRYSIKDSKPESNKPSDKKIELKQDKSFLENLKKDAQSKLDALTYAEAKGKKGEELRKKIAEYDRKLKVYSVSSKSSPNPKSSYNAIVGENEKIDKILSDTAIEQKRRQEDLENQIAQSKIDAMQNGFEKQRRQRELNNKKEIQEVERQKVDYRKAYIQAQRELFDANENLKLKKNSKYKKRTFDASSVHVDTSDFDVILSNTKKKQLIQSDQEEENANNDYLSKYGDYNQKKLAIAKVYQEKINKATTEGEKKSLQKELQNSLRDLDFSRFKDGINWEGLFGNIERASKSMLTNLKRQLVQYVSSDEFKQLSPENQRTVVEGLTKVNDALLNSENVFSALSDSLKAYKEAKEELLSAQLNADIVNSQDWRTDDEKQKANNRLHKAQNQVGDATAGRDNAIDRLVKLNDVIAKLGSTSKLSISELGSLVGEVAQAFSKAGSKIGGIIGAIFDLLDVISRQGLAKFVENIVNVVADAVGGILSTVGNIVTLGAFHLGGADYSSYNEMKQKYETLNKIWDELIDKKKTYLKESYGSEVTRTEKEIESILEKQIESYKKLGKERLNSGASTGSSSIGKRQWKSQDEETLAQLQSVLGPDYKKILGETRMTGLFDLSIEQLNDLKLQAPEFWATLDDDVRTYLEDIIKANEAQKEALEEAKTQMLGTSFDTIKSDFASMLEDMGSDWYDSSDKWGKYMQKQIINSMIMNKYKDKLQAYYDSWYKDANSDNTITKQEYDTLKSQWEELSKAALDERNNLMDLYGWTSDSSQSASSATSVSATQESVSEVNGRLTAVEELMIARNANDLEIKASILSMLAFANSISVSIDSRNRTLDEIRNLMITWNTYFEDIAKYQKVISGYDEKLDTLIKQTK